jgi:thiol:disulfide interchange protein
MIELSRTVLRFVLVITTLLVAMAAMGQSTHAIWSAKLDPADARAGESARILLTAKVAKPYHLYSLQKPVGEGPSPTKITLKPGGSLEAQGEAIEPPPHIIEDPGFEIKVGIHEGEPVFSIPVKLKSGISGEQKATVDLDFQTCNDTTCDPPAKQPIEVKFTVSPGEPRPDRLAALVAVPDQPGGPQQATPAKVETGKGVAVSGSTGDDQVDQLLKAQQTSLPAYLWLCFLAGLASLLMPCVFPMIPITVSFFSKKSGDEKKTHYSGALAYCLGIIATFTALGLIVTAVFGATGIQKLAGSPIVNIFLSVLFIALALSLFGMFEIVVPASITTKLSNKSRVGGLVGPLLMGLTFSLTSFTCTVPVVGTLLLAASKGNFLYPTLGMLAFSTAFSLPFFLLALFPQAVSKLPRSGSWMSTVKAFMGFFELAFALKFISNLDLVWNLGWLTREVFLAIWAAIAFVAAIYLFGWMRMKNEDGTPKIGIFRYGFGLATVFAAGLCLAGIQGFSLGTMDAFVPPNPYPGREAAPGTEKIEWVRDYKTAVAQAKAENRLMFINFTGAMCTNCRQMEKTVLREGEVLREIDGMVAVELYTDRGTPSDNFNRDLEQQLVDTVSLPVYVVVSPEGKVLKRIEGLQPLDKFVAFLKTGKQNHNAVALR